VKAGHGGADDIGERAEPVLHVHAEYQAGGVAGNARQRHQMLRPDPDDRFVNPDDDTAEKPAEQTGAHGLAKPARIDGVRQHG